MEIRVGMVYLLDRVRTMINQQPMTVLDIANSEIQDALDQHRKESRYCQLEPLATIHRGGSALYLDFNAPLGAWEGPSYDSVAGTARYYDGTAGFCLVDGTFGTITPSTWNLWTGRFTFSGSAQAPYGPLRPVMLNGYCYDVYGAAADLLELRAAQVSEHFDFEDQGQKFTRSQKQKMILEVVERYRRRQWTQYSEFSTPGAY